jgi:hypothetical protein
VDVSYTHGGDLAFSVEDDTNHRHLNHFSTMADSPLPSLPPEPPDQLPSTSVELSINQSVDSGAKNPVVPSPAIDKSTDSVFFGWGRGKAISRVRPTCVTSMSL